MSKMIINFLNDYSITKDITNTYVSVIKDFIRIEYAEDDICYIPLQNVGEVRIKGKKKG